MFPDPCPFTCRSKSQRDTARSEAECCSESAFQTHRRTCLQQLAALSAAAIVAPAHAAIVDEDVARRVFDSAGHLTLSLYMTPCFTSTGSL